MKIFVLVLIAAAVIGGFIGGEISGETFTVWGAAAGSVGTFAALMGLGAFFSHQEKKKDAEVKLTPEMRDVFARMAERHVAKGRPRGRQHQQRPEMPSLDATVRSLVEQDLETAAAGKIPERRLIPHHAIKRDVIVKAFEADFRRLTPRLQELNQEHFQSEIDRIRRLDHNDLDSLLTTMSEERGDLAELERQVREERPIYSMVEPLF